MSAPRGPTSASRPPALAETATSLRAAVVGVSTSPTCGVRDHAELLDVGLSARGVSCSTYWLARVGGSIGEAHSEIRDWTQGLVQELGGGRFDVILLHYSVFVYSYRGLPIFVRPVLSALRRAGIPIVTVLHEYAYPLGRGGVHGTAWALSQRALLVEVIRASSRVVVTASFRADWLASRVWLPRRPAIVAPVFSNLPPPASTSPEHARSGVIGLFGYAHEGAAVSLVLDALRILREQGVAAELVLLGAPGRPSRAADMWLEGARSRGVEQALSFSGKMPAQALSNALAGCDVLLSAEPSGPTSRKTTLAASLASGTAVVALDGPLRWSDLVESQVAMIVPSTAPALARAVAGLLEDDGRRAELGKRGRAFAERNMSAQQSAQIVARQLAQAVAGA